MILINSESQDKQNEWEQEVASRRKHLTGRAQRRFGRKEPAVESSWRLGEA